MVDTDAYVMCVHVLFCELDAGACATCVFNL